MKWPSIAAEDGSEPIRYRTALTPPAGNVFLAAGLVAPQRGLFLWWKDSDEVPPPGRGQPFHGTLVDMAALARRDESIGAAPPPWGEGAAFAIFECPALTDTHFSGTTPVLDDKVRSSPYAQVQWPEGIAVVWEGTQSSTEAEIIWFASGSGNTVATTSRRIPAALVKNYLPAFPGPGRAVGFACPVQRGTTWGLEVQLYPQSGPVQTWDVPLDVPNIDVLSVVVFGVDRNRPQHVLLQALVTTQFNQVGINYRVDMTTGRATRVTVPIGPDPSGLRSGRVYVGRSRSKEPLPDGANASMDLEGLPSVETPNLWDGYTPRPANGWIVEEDSIHETFVRPMGPVRARKQFGLIG